MNILSNKFKERACSLSLYRGTKIYNNFKNSSMNISFQHKSASLHQWPRTPYIHSPPLRKLRSVYTQIYSEVLLSLYIQCSLLCFFMYCILEISLWICPFSSNLTISAQNFQFCPNSSKVHSFIICYSQIVFHCVIISTFSHFSWTLGLFTYLGSCELNVRENFAYKYGRV